ncbi:MAG TPA: tRNA preQ1(34) S-adenosylmethionine ribosyltransferase-isomerase QueA [Pyrinomonadaceae bacterium]|nr:tRNA preQ1(34) S-adenosylmethionine ribosyltransferase-isomerase QueA [Pyrinomonadaceae bacterium]
MRLDDLDFILPPEQIAQTPLADRSASRMLTVDRRTGKFHDANFTDLASELGPRDILVLNNTKVFPARLFGQIETGAAIEMLLTEEIEPLVWDAVARPGKRLAPGKRVIFDETFSAVVIEKLDGGRVRFRFETDGDLEAEIDRLGKTPLPPYITPDEGKREFDRERYQTVFAAERGAIAAPTAGLHFTDEILKRIRANGTEIVELTLHVGYGTFEPVRVEELAEHRVLPERFSISDETASALNDSLEAGKRIVAVGTTTTRALESAIRETGKFKPGAGIADLTITPGYEFKAVSALITNFHLPKSSLLILVSTFGGHELIMNAYEHAVRAGYRFYSYGDCMFVK